MALPDTTESQILERNVIIEEGLAVRGIVIGVLKVWL